MGFLPEDQMKPGPEIYGACERNDQQTCLDYDQLAQIYECDLVSQEMTSPVEISQGFEDDVFFQQTSHALDAWYDLVFGAVKSRFVSGHDYGIDVFVRSENHTVGKDFHSDFFVSDDLCLRHIVENLNADLCSFGFRHHPGPRVCEKRKKQQALLWRGQISRQDLGYLLTFGDAFAHDVMGFHLSLDRGLCHGLCVDDSSCACGSFCVYASCYFLPQNELTRRQSLPLGHHHDLFSSEGQPHASQSYQNGYDRLSC